MKHFSILILLVTAFMGSGAALAQDQLDRETRLLIIEGNKMYNKERYAEAEEVYKKALERAPHSDLARYNLAASYLRQGNGTNETVNLVQDAARILDDIARNSDDNRLKELAAYNAGNIQFNNEQYGPSIEYYKMALRVNPDNDQARENLRIAQLKQQEQQNQNQDQNQDQNKDQQQQQQDQQQNQDQNQDQNQQQQPQQPQQQQEINDQNAEAILKTMQNEENKTRERIEKRKKTDNSRKRVTNPW